MFYQGLYKYKPNQKCAIVFTVVIVYSLHEQYFTSHLHNELKAGNLTTETSQISSCEEEKQKLHIVS